MLRLKALAACCCFGSGPEEAKSAFEPSSKLQDRSFSGLLEPQGVEGKQKSDISSKQSDKSELVELDLEVLESSTLEVGRVFKIRPDGVVGAISAAIDGQFRFGSSREGNQIALPAEEGLGSSHFAIIFRPNECAYFLKDLGDGTGTFMRIDRLLQLKTRYIISFGENHLGILISQKTTGSFIGLKFLDGPMSDKQYEFNQTAVVKVGRTVDCQVRLDSTSMSRIQCTIKFTEELNWTIIDGDGIRGSTNGTWLYIDEPYELSEETVFKAGQTLYVARPLVSHVT